MRRLLAERVDAHRRSGQEGRLRRSLGAGVPGQGSRAGARRAKAQLPAERRLPARSAVERLRPRRVGARRRGRHWKPHRRRRRVPRSCRCVAGRSNGCSARFRSKRERRDEAARCDDRARRRGGGGRARLRAHKPVTSKYTYTEDVYPIVKEHCGGCHVGGRHRADVAADVRRGARPWADRSVWSSRAGHMPPWYGDPGVAPLRDVHRLSPRDLDVVLTWVTGGTPPGRADEDCAGDSAPLVAERPAGSRDLQMPAPVTLAADKSEDTQEFVLRGDNDRDRMVAVADLLPGNPAIVHDAIIFSRRPGAAEPAAVSNVWLPGSAPVGSGSWLWHSMARRRSARRSDSLQEELEARKQAGLGSERCRSLSDEVDGARNPRRRHQRRRRARRSIAGACDSRGRREQRRSGASGCDSTRWDASYNRRLRRTRRLGSAVLAGASHRFAEGQPHRRASCSCNERPCLARRVDDVTDRQRVTISHRWPPVPSAWASSRGTQVSRRYVDAHQQGDADRGRRRHRRNFFRLRHRGASAGCALACGRRAGGGVWRCRSVRRSVCDSAQLCAHVP